MAWIRLSVINIKLSVSKFYAVGHIVSILAASSNLVFNLGLM